MSRHVLTRGTYPLPSPLSLVKSLHRPTLTLWDFIPLVLLPPLILLKVQNRTHHYPPLQHKILFFIETFLLLLNSKTSVFGLT